ncbi:MAG: hypothetical protein WBP89_14900 [Sedimenticolaceae bacterium]
MSLRPSAIGIALLLLSTSAPATDLGLNAYLGLPFGGDGPFFGVKTGPDSQIFSLAGDAPEDAPNATIDFRFGGEDGSTLSMNGIPVVRSPIRYASEDETADSGRKDLGWWTVVGLAASVGLIYAFVQSDSDVKVNVCSGPNCPPEEKPPPEEPETPDQDTGT